MKITFKRNKNGQVNFNLQGLTQGAALSIARAIKNHAAISAIGEDLKIALKNAIQQDTSYAYRDQNQQLMDWINGLPA